MKYFVYLFLFINSLPSIANSKIQYFISDKASSPIQISDAKGNLKGIVTDVILAFESKDINFKHTILPFNRMIRTMLVPDIVWLTYGSAAWPGAQSTSLSKTEIMTVTHSLLTLKHNNADSFEGFLGKRLVLIRGFDYPGLQKYINNNQVETMYVKDHEAALKAVINGRADAFAGMELRLRYHIKKQQLMNDKFKYINISHISPNYNINLCFSKNFPIELRSKIEQILVEMKMSGELKQIVDKYNVKT